MRGNSGRFVADSSAACRMNNASSWLIDLAGTLGLSCMGVNIARWSPRQREPFLAAFGDSGFVKSTVLMLSLGADECAQRGVAVAQAGWKATLFVTRSTGPWDTPGPHCRTIMGSRSARPGAGR
jgi:hypothetical protein